MDEHTDAVGHTDVGAGRATEHGSTAYLNQVLRASPGGPGGPTHAHGLWEHLHALPEPAQHPAAGTAKGQTDTAHPALPAPATTP